MLDNKLVKMVLLFLKDGEKKRWEVTNKMRNYPREEKDLAVKYLFDNGLVSIREDVERVGLGRTPAYIRLTQKGQEAAKGLSEAPINKGLWVI